MLDHTVNEVTPVANWTAQPPQALASVRAHHITPPKTPHSDLPAQPNPAEERQLLYAGMLARMDGDTSANAQKDRLDIFRQLAAMLRSNQAGLVKPLYEALADIPTLTVVSSDGSKNAGQSSHVPNACVLEIGASHAAWPERARAAARLAQSEYLTLATDEVPPTIPLLAQLLQASAENLAACLPLQDPLAYEHGTPAPTLIPWTVFRRALLLQPPPPDADSEGAFWTQLGRAGRIGALPPDPIARPSHAAARVQAAGIPALQHQPESPSALALALVDQDWYRATYPDVAAERVDPARHYADYGWREGRDPNPWFSTRWYLARTPSIQQTGIMPLLDFVENARSATRRPHPGFFPKWYAHRYQGVTDATHALLHFLTIGARHGAVPGPALDREEVAGRLRLTPEHERPELLQQLQAALPRDEDLAVNLVDGRWYVEQHPDVVSVGMSAVEHYLSYGWQEQRNPSPWFDTSWYLRKYPEAGAWHACPLDHFVMQGAAQGCRPSPGFDPAWYATRHLGQDAPAAQGLHHFLRMGWTNGLLPDPLLDETGRRTRFKQCPRERQPGFAAELRLEGEQELDLLRSLVDSAWYQSTYPGAVSETGDAFQHFQTEGWRAGLSPNPWFSTPYYLEGTQEALQPDESPLHHFVRTGAAAGRRPHPSFDTEWYSRQYLSGSQPQAEALRHFLNTGLAAGAVPNPAIHCGSVQEWLLETPEPTRTDKLHRLLSLVASLHQPAGVWCPEHADLWPPLLRRHFPDKALGVLLLCPKETGEALIRVAMAVLPMQEYPLLCFAESRNKVRIASAPGAADPSVAITLPQQAQALRSLLTAARCTRAAFVGSGSGMEGLARIIRNAGLPVTVNGQPTPAPT